MSKEELLGRLRRIEGQIRGVQTMIKEQRDCEEILTQIMAARAALEQVAVVLVNEYLGECINHLETQADREKLLRTISLFLKRW